MNRQRRKDLAAALALVEQAVALLEEAAEMIGQARDDEQEYVDNMPDSVREGERGSAAQEAADALDDAWTLLDEFDHKAIAEAIRDAVGGGM